MKLEIGTIQPKGVFGKAIKAINGEQSLVLSLPSVVLIQGHVGSGAESFTIGLAQQALKQGAAINYIDKINNGLSGKTLSNLGIPNLIGNQHYVDIDTASAAFYAQTKNGNSVFYAGISDFTNQSLSEEQRLQVLSSSMDSLINQLQGRMVLPQEKRTPLVTVFSGILSMLHNASEINKPFADNILDRLNVLVAQLRSLDTMLLFSEYDTVVANACVMQGFFDGGLACVIDLSATSPKFNGEVGELKTGEALVWHYQQGSLRVQLASPDHSPRASLTAA